MKKNIFYIYVRLFILIKMFWLFNVPHLSIHLKKSRLHKTSSIKTINGNER